MNIVACAHNFYGTKNGVAGGEVYLYRLLCALRNYGHSIKVMVHHPERYVYDGFECIPSTGMERIFIDNNDVFAWADVVFYQLIANSYGYNKAKQHKKPSLFISHNYGRHYFLEPHTRVLYNSETMRGIYPNEGTVLTPLVDYRDYTLSTGKKIALINCNEMKGGKEFVQIAKLMPDKQFLGIKGNYGQQITPDIPNIEWRENGVIPWNEIGILLVPSYMESWSQVATEAICCGIPVICNDLPGLRENLGYAGVYIENNNVNSYVGAIRELWGYGEIRNLCLQRAKEQDPKPRVEVFEKWLVNWIEDERNK